eukprot:3188083-Rhodomonas_salina.1
MQCVVLRQRMLLCYAQYWPSVSTGIAYAATRCACYAECGTDIPYGATRESKELGITLRYPPTL